MRLTAAEYLNLGEDDCTDSLSPEESSASLAEDFYTSVQGKNDSGHKFQPMTPELSTKDAFKALGFVSTLLDES